MAGQKVIYNMSVEAIYEYQYAVYDDAFVATVSPCKTVAEYETMLYRQVRDDLVWKQYVATAKVLEYPASEVNEYTLDFIEYYNSSASGAGITLEEYVANKFFMELETFHLQADVYAKNHVKEELVLYQAARVLGLGLSDSEYAAGAAEYAAMYGYASAAELESTYGSNFVHYSVLRDKVSAHLASLAQITTKE